MCILFLYNGVGDEDSDYSLILISNRDEYYDRPTEKMATWEHAEGEHVVIGGRDLEVKGGGTWLAISTTLKRIGVLLNIPGGDKKNTKSRGQIASDYAHGYQESVEKYMKHLKIHSHEHNYYIFVSIEYGKPNIPISSYNNVTDELIAHNESHIGFGNSVPNKPLNKVMAGKKTMEEICKKFSKENSESELMENLIALLRSEERHLPDQQLYARQPQMYKELSSIYVCIPQMRYGTRTHTIVLLTKTGRLLITELTQQMPIDPLNPKWDKTEYTYTV